MRSLASRLAGPVTGRRVLLVLLAGAALRLALLRFPRLWYDEATTGIMGLTVLHGALPVYFYGQAFMGALDAYLAAPLYLLLGVSARTLELAAVLAGLVWIGLVARLAWDAFGPRAALLTAVILAAPPDFALHWAHEARLHYPLAMGLGTLALLLALRVPALSPPRATAACAVLGGVLGLAFWTNFLSLVYFPAVGILLLRGGLSRARARQALAGVAAFVLGSLPHWLYGVPHGTAVPPPGRRIGLLDVWHHLGFVRRISWPILTGIPPGARDTVVGAILALALAGVYGLALAAALRAVWRGGPRERAASLALLLLVVANLGAAVGTQYGRGLDDHDQKYLLPLYTALPILLGRWLAGLAGWAAGSLVAALLLVHVAGAFQGELPNLAPPATSPQRFEVRVQRDAVAALAREGPRRLYSGDFGSRTLTFLSAERVVFSDHYQEIYPPYARAVDGAPAVGWFARRRSATFEANLDALGVRFDYRRVARLGGAYVDFRLPPEALRELDPGRLAVSASESPEAAPWMVDRDAQTLWRTARPQRGGEWIQVDLGAPEPVALLRWLPGAMQEVPGGLTVETSLDGRAWARRLALPSYFGPLYWSAGRPMARVRGGRVELRLEPRPARFVRVTQTGQSPLWPWSLREFFVYAATGAPAPTPPAGDGVALARALRAAGATRLYADAGWGSRVALADPQIWTVPTNLWLNPYGYIGPVGMLLAPFRWTPETAVLLEPADAEGFASAARASGLGMTQATVDGLVLYAYAPPVPAPAARALPAVALRVTASREPERAGLAVDGDPATRWATARHQTPGDWVRIDLAPARAVRGVRLWTAYPTDSPRGLGLEGSEDGVGWRPLAAEVRREGAHRWGGIALLRDGVEAVRLDFAPVVLRALRLTLTRGDPIFDWSIHELAVYAAD